MPCETATSSQTDYTYINNLSGGGEIQFTLTFFKKGCCSSQLWRKTTFISVSVSMRTQSLSSLKCRQPVSILSDVTSWNPAAANQSPASSYYCLRPVFFFFFFYFLFLSAQGEGEGKRGMPSTYADIITVIISFLISTKP